jgi:hypothetical protein
MKVPCSRFLTVGFAVLLATALSGCSTQAKRVDCDGQLTPINQPVRPFAPVSAVPTPPKSDRGGDGK